MEQEISNPTNQIMTHQFVQKKIYKSLQVYYYSYYIVSSLSRVHSYLFILKGKNNYSIKIQGDGYEDLQVDLGI